MTLSVRHKFAHYRRFELDIWGVCFNDVRAHKITRKTTRKQLSTKVKSLYFKFFYRLWKNLKLRVEASRQRYVYRLDMLPPDRLRKPFKQRFLSIRLTRLFFITLQDHQFRALFKRASKADGNMDENYCFLLEGRAIMILYRTLFVSNPFEAIRFIKNGLFYYDRQKIRSIDYLIYPGKFFHILPNIIDRVRNYIRIRAKSKATLFNIPKFMFISFLMITGFLLNKPKRKFLVYPINIDIQRITGYY